MASTPSSKRPLPEGWVVRESKSRAGRRYYFQVMTGTSSWKHPDDISPKEEISKSKRELKRSHNNCETGSTTSSALEYIAKRRMTSPLTSPEFSSQSSNTRTSQKNTSEAKRSTKQRKQVSSPNTPLTSSNLLQYSDLTNKTAKDSLKKKEDPKSAKPTSPVKFACSKVKANHIASWLSSVNDSFEPNGQEGAVGDVEKAKAQLDFDEGKGKSEVAVGKHALPHSRTSGVSSKESELQNSGDGESTIKGAQNAPSKPLRESTTCQNSEPSVKVRVRTLSSSSRCSSNLPISPPVGFTPFGQFANNSTVNTQPKPSMPMNIDPAPTSQPEATMQSSAPGPLHNVNQPFGQVTSQEQHPNVSSGKPGAFTMNLFGFTQAVHPSVDTRPFMPVPFGTNTVLLNSRGVINDGPVMGNTAFEGQAAHDSGYDDMIDMEVDNCEELHESIMAELHEVRSSFVVNPEQMSQEIPNSSAQSSYGDGLYIILDTNILLSHLKFVTELKDFPIEGIGRPILIVPWIVMQELDSLKSDSWKIRKGKLVTEENKKSVDIQARQAVRFLHSCFESRHPRIRGQTLAEANEHVSNMPEENNDDRILHCCLLFQMKASNGNAVLFSNDQNLCSKAMINGIRAFQSHNLIDGLKDIFHDKQLVIRADYFTDYYDQLKIQEKLAERRAKADDIICELQCVMREGLAVIVETEMRAAYDDLWDTIVYLKPPWTLRDLLQIIDKHWIAVFGDVIRRNHQATIKDLKKQLNPEKGVSGCIANASTLLDTAHTLFKAFAARSSYNGSVTKCLAAIVVLKKKCQDCKEDSPSPPSSVIPVRPNNPIMPAPPSTLQALPSPHSTAPSRSVTQIDENTPPSSDETASVVSHSSIQGEINTGALSKPYEEVLSAFDVIWNAVNQFSAQIFSALSYPHSLPMSLIENLPKPTKEEAVNFLCRLCPCLGSLVSALQHVLRLPAELSSEPQSFNSLLSAIARFLQEILSLECKVTSQSLCQFCQNPNSRTALIQGLSQLDRAFAMLQHCSSCVAQV